MPMFRRDPEKALAKSHEAMVAKLAAKGDTLATALRNEMASARQGYAADPIPSTARSRATADRWVAEEGMNLERSRPADRRNRRSVDVDRVGWAPAGVHAARHPDVDGRLPYARWPETSAPPRGTPSSHDYGPPTVHLVVDTRDSGRVENPNPRPGYRS